MKIEASKKKMISSNIDAMFFLSQLASVFDDRRRSYRTPESYRIPYQLDPDVDNHSIAKRNKNERNRWHESETYLHLVWWDSFVDGGIVWHHMGVAVTRIKDLEQEFTLRVAMLIYLLDGKKHN